MWVGTDVTPNHYKHSFSATNDLISSDFQKYKNKFSFYDVQNILAINYISTFPRQSSTGLRSLWMCLRAFWMTLIYGRSATCRYVTDTLANQAHAPWEAFLSWAPGDSSGLAINDRRDTKSQHATFTQQRASTALGAHVERYCAF